MQYSAVAARVDLDLLRIFRAATGKKGLAATRTGALLGRQFDELVTNLQMRVIPSFGSGVVRLLAPFPLRFLGIVLGIIQVIGAILSSRGLGTSPEKVGFELAFFTFELFDFLFQLGDALQGIAMATFPISDLLAEFKVFTLETLNLGAELRDFLAQRPYQDHQLRGGVDRATDLYQLASHDHLGLPNTVEKGKGLAPLHPAQRRQPNDVSWIRETFSQRRRGRRSAFPCRPPGGKPDLHSGRHQHQLGWIYPVPERSAKLYPAPRISKNAVRRSVKIVFSRHSHRASASPHR